MVFLGISFLMSIFLVSLECGLLSDVVERSNQLPNWEGNKGNSIIMYCHTVDGSEIPHQLIW